METIKTTHDLVFEVANWISPLWMRFRVGTVNGLWGSTDISYDILAVANDQSGNGHLTDLFEIFYHSCKRDKKHLIIYEIWNKRFYEHLINKKGFEVLNERNLIKKYENM
jgi:hypothetical protein